MSTGYERDGRTNQKQRTRNALLAAARELLAGGTVPTVDAAAARASISRTTAYRYFSSQEGLLVAAYPELVVETLLPQDAPTEPAARLDRVVTALTRINVETEPQLRAVLRLSLARGTIAPGGLTLRRGRAIRWIEEALSPLTSKLSPAEVHRLALAIRAAVGIEALVWLTDVGGLSREQASEIQRWSAQALLRSALAGAPPPGRPAGAQRAQRRRAGAY